MQEWLKRRPVVFASLGALIAAADGLWLFDDVRAAIVGGVVTFAAAYLTGDPAASVGRSRRTTSAGERSTGTTSGPFGCCEGWRS
jgi:hypothetical protein